MKRLRIPSLVFRLFVIVVPSVCGCALSPTVTLRNETDTPVSGYVQIPSLTHHKLNPQPASRERFRLAPNAERAYRRSHRREDHVESWPSNVYIAIWNRDHWYMTRVQLTRPLSLHFAIRIHESGNHYIVPESPVEVEEIIIQPEDLIEILGGRRGR